MRENYFKDMYTDFFGIESLPKIDVKEEKDKGPRQEMASLFLKINNLMVSDESKELLKKIIEYMRKYHEGIETNYIPFRIIIETNTDTTTHEINDILYSAGKYFDYINNKQKVISLYKITKEENYLDYGFILLHDLNGLNMFSDLDSKKIIYELDNFLKEDAKTITMIAGSKEEIDNFFLGREELKNKYFDFVINGINPDIQDIYNDILNKVSVNNAMQVELLDYLTNTYTKDMDYITYKNDIIKYISFNKEIPKLDKVKTIDEVFANLNELVGLEKVKKVLHELVDVISLKEKAGDNLKILVLVRQLLPE